MSTPEYQAGEKSHIVPNCTTSDCGENELVQPELSNLPVKATMKIYPVDSTSYIETSALERDGHITTVFRDAMDSIVEQQLGNDNLENVGNNLTNILSYSEYILPRLNESFILNSTTNISNSQMDLPEVPEKNWAVLAVIPIVAFVAMGNILVIMAVTMDHKLRSSTNYFLTSLAVADLLVAIIVMPPSLAMIINNYVWPLDERLCGVWVMLDVCFSTSSILHLCMISLDRYLALAKPFRYNNEGWLSKHSSGGRSTEKRGNSRWRIGSGSSGGPSKMTKRVAKRILLVWAVSIGIALPLPILASQDRNNLFYGDMCTINIPDFAIYGSLVAFFLPLVVMFITYSLTIRTLQKQSQLVACMMGNASPIKRATSNSSSVSSRISQKINSEKSNGEAKNNASKPKTEERKTLFHKNGSQRHGNNRNDPSSTGVTYSNENGTTYEKIPLQNESSVESTVSLQYSSSTRAGSKLKRWAMQCCQSVRCGRSKPRPEDIIKQDMDSEYSTRQAGLHKSDSDSSDLSSNNQPVKRSPLLTRANLKLAKAVSKLPLRRASARRMSVSMKSRAIATEQRASKVLGMIFTLFCIFWCPFFITNVLSNLCTNCNQELMGELMNWFVWAGYVSSGINPCVYTLFSKRFRNTFHKLILRRYDQIGHKRLHRGYSGGGGGFNSSARVRANFQYSMESRDSFTANSELVRSYRRPVAPARRTFGESVIIHQHRRSQYTRSVDGEALLGNRHRKNSMQFHQQRVENNLIDEDEFRQKMQELRLKWRTTWPATNDRNEKDDMSGLKNETTSARNNVTVKNFSGNQENERGASRCRSSRQRRILSAPSSTGRKWSSLYSPQPQPKKSSVKDSTMEPLLQSGVKMTSQSTRSSEGQYFRSSEERYTSSGEESEYDNNNMEDVFLDSKPEITSDNDIRDLRKPSISRTDGDEVFTTRSRIFSDISEHCNNCVEGQTQRNSTSKLYCISETDKLHTLPDSCCHDRSIMGEVEPKTKGFDFIFDLKYSNQDQLSRLDSGMGESVRNSQSF